MAYFEIKFNTDNAAFADDKRSETIETLNRVIKHIDKRESTGGIIRDINGNRIGSWGFYRS